MKCILKGLKCALFGALIAIVLGFAVMFLWNWLAPSLFGWRVVSFWQALGILVLSKILFGGFRGGRCCKPGLMGRWSGMTPEERERFRKGLQCAPCEPGEEQKT